MSTSEMNVPARPRTDRRRLVTDLLSGGGVTLLIGLMFLVVARIFPPLALPGTVCVAVGAALLVVGCVIYPFVRRPRITV